jgi:hypothetical protein
MLNTTTRPLALHNILHMPDISKNLLSAHKFSCDNDVFFECHLWHFFVKDQQSRKALLEGRCEPSLYPIKSSDASSLHHALLSHSTSRVQWHARLCHPSNQIVHSILRLNNILFANESSLPICNACQLAKSHQLPYTTSLHHLIAPLELIFFDVWGPAPQSVGDFKYYISFIDVFSKFSWIYLVHDRSDTTSIFMQFQAHVEHLLDAKIKCVQSDCGGEYQKIHNTFFTLLALVIVFPVLIHTNKTALLNSSTAIL